MISAHLTDLGHFDRIVVVLQYHYYSIKGGNIMPRPYSFPDPNDRSPNNPSTILSSEQVLGLYKRGTGEKMEKVTEKVRNWIIDQAKAMGWDEGFFSGGQCVLTKKF